MTKTVFVVKGRLEPDKEFKPLEVNSHFAEFSDAQKRLNEWIDSKADITKAKPEATIETEELPHLADCKICHIPLFLGQIVFHTRLGKYCYECSSQSAPMADGFYDLLEPEDSSSFSLDKIGGI